MSEYSARPSRRSTRTREPEYIETEDVYARGPGSRDLVIRDRDRRTEYDDDYPEYRRSSHREDYGPPEPRARSHGQRGHDYYYDDDYYSDYDQRSRRGRSRKYDDDFYDDYRPHRRKSTVGEMLEVFTPHSPHQICAYKFPGRWSR